MQKQTSLYSYSSGFTLIEMSIVLVLLSLVAGGGLHALNTHLQQKRDIVTRERLKEARIALLHFVQIYGYLPCPADETELRMQKKDGGWEKRNAAGQCVRSDGFLPALSLGLSETDEQGYAVDGWDRRPNRIRYALAQTMYPVSSLQGCSSEEATGINVSSLISNTKETASLNQLYWGGTAFSQYPLRRFGLCVCTKAKCADGVGVSAAAVIYTLGENAYWLPTELVGHADEQENLNQDRIFVEHSLTQNFDDHLTWISSESLWGALLEAKSLERPIQREKALPLLEKTQADPVENVKTITIK